MFSAATPATAVEKRRMATIACASASRSGTPAASRRAVRRVWVKVAYMSPVSRSRTFSVSPAMVRSSRSIAPSSATLSSRASAIEVVTAAAAASGGISPASARQRPSACSSVVSRGSMAAARDSLVTAARTSRAAPSSRST